MPWTEGTLIPLGFQKGNLEPASDYALLPQHKPTCKVKTITLKKVYTNQPVLNNKYKNIYIYKYIHMQSCGNNMSADEMEIKRIAFFHLWGTLLRDPLQSPLTDHSSQARPSSPRKKGSPKFRQSITVSTLGSSAKLLALETLAYQDFFPK